MTSKGKRKGQDQPNKRGNNKANKPQMATKKYLRYSKVKKVDGKFGWKIISLLIQTAMKLITSLVTLSNKVLSACKEV